MLILIVLLAAAAFALLGCEIGEVVGRKLWGNVGRWILGTLLGLAFFIVGLVVGGMLLW